MNGCLVYFRGLKMNNNVRLINSQQDQKSNQSIRSIYERLFEITHDVDSIEKKGYNSHSNYRYLRAIDIVTGIKSLLKKHRVGLEIKEKELIRKEIGKNFHSELHCEAIFYCIDNPSDNKMTPYISISSDRLDKDIFKAKTNGLKYLFIQEFQIETEDGLIDTEQNNPAEKEQRERPLHEQKKDFQNQIAQERRQQYNKPGPRPRNNQRSYNKNDNYNKKRSNSGEQLTLNQMNFINRMQSELGYIYHSEPEILAMNKKQASEAIEFLKSELNYR
jgi:hypothetical protein